MALVTCVRLAPAVLRGSVGNSSRLVSRTRGARATRARPTPWIREGTTRGRRTPLGGGKRSRLSACSRGPTAGWRFVEPSVRVQVAAGAFVPVSLRAVTPTRDEIRAISSAGVAEERILAVFRGLPGKVRSLMMLRIYDVVFTSSRIVGIPRDRVPKSALLGGALVASLATVGSSEAVRAQPLAYDPPSFDRVLQTDRDSFAVTYPELIKARVYTNIPGYVLSLKDARTTRSFSTLRNEEGKEMKRLLGQLASHAYR